MIVVGDEDIDISDTDDICIDNSDGDSGNDDDNDDDSNHIHHTLVVGTVLTRHVPSRGRS